ncbi:permease [Actinoplanes sp. OR16]|uniref:SLC13 family permease n=1 Tax=Actinoplanes sp. OR16 TaxID=946334 RepID=UPI000F6C33EF|nr:SLC13 family permease [Actinoplanes sp. OR16]BBH68766.1 permease [Actinoplanes sp. OR16]
MTLDVATRRPAAITAWAVAAAGLVAALVCGLTTGTPTIWGLLPIGLFGVLVVSGMGMLPAALVSTLAALLVLLPAPAGLGSLAVASIGNQVTLIGVIIVLGAAVGEVMRRTRVADVIVRACVGLVDGRGPRVTSFAIMVACLILVAALGTLGGALAVAAPLVIPVAARLGYTRSATAAMMFVGGCAGLALAPFAGSNVAIMSAADAGYGQYLLYGALPLVAVSLLVGLPVVSWMQRHSTDHYDDEDRASEEQATAPGRRASIATAVFASVLVAAVVWAIVANAGLVVPLVALPLLGVLTGLAGGLGFTGTLRALAAGGRGMLGMLGLFLLLAALFVAIEELGPFDVVLARYGDQMAGLSPFALAIAIALLGWVGVPGATAAQVVLLDQLFGEIAASAGIGMASWIVVLLFASKADTYGPFPNANMIGAMGLARCLNLRAILLAGWAILIPAVGVYAILLYIEL